MRVAWSAWVQGLLGLAKAALFVTIAVIPVVNAKQLRLPVSTEMPRTVYDLMDPYPEGVKGRPPVLYVPVRRGAGGLDSLPQLPGLFP